MCRRRVSSLEIFFLSTAASKASLGLKLSSFAKAFFVFHNLFVNWVCLVRSIEDDLDKYSVNLFVALAESLNYALSLVSSPSETICSKSLRQLLKFWHIFVITPLSKKPRNGFHVHSLGPNLYSLNDPNHFRRWNHQCLHIFFLCSFQYFDQSRILLMNYDLVKENIHFRVFLR